MSSLKSSVLSWTVSRYNVRAAKNYQHWQVKKTTADTVSITIRKNTKSICSGYIKDCFTS